MYILKVVSHAFTLLDSHYLSEFKRRTGLESFNGSGKENGKLLIFNNAAANTKRGYKILDRVTFLTPEVSLNKSQFFPYHCK